jgi:hypothetical protein
MGKIKKYNNHDYDTSWDLMESNKGYLPIHEHAFEKISGMENKRLAAMAKRSPG